MKPSEQDRFEIEIFWIDENDAYIAVVPDIPSCTAWGETNEEAPKERKTAIHGNSEVAREFFATPSLNRGLAKPSKVPPEELHLRPREDPDSLS